MDRRIKLQIIEAIENLIKAADIKDLVEIINNEDLRDYDNKAISKGEIAIHLLKNMEDD